METRATDKYGDLNGFSFAIPTAAPVADQPTTLSGPLGRPSLAAPGPYLLAHISDTTSTSPASPAAD